MRRRGNLLGHMLALVGRGAGGLLICLLLCCAGAERDDSKKSKSLADRAVTGPLEEGGAVWEFGHTYSFDLRSSVLVDFGKGQSSVSYELDGNVEIAVADQRDGRTTLQLRLGKLAMRNRLPGDGSNLDRLARELEKGSGICVLSGGRLVEFGFRKESSSSAANTFREIAAGLQLAIARGARSGLTEEYDTTGQFEARYVFEDDSKSYLKRKTRYLALLGRPLATNGVPVQVVPEVTKSEGRIRLSAAGGLELVLLRDELVLRGAQLPIHSSTELELRLVAVGGAQPPASLALWMSEFTVVPASEPNRAAAGVEALDRARTAGASFREIIARVEAEQLKGSGRGPHKVVKANPAGALPEAPGRAEGKGDPALFDSLTASLRSQEGAVAEAVRLTASRPAVSATLIDALGAASCAKCQSALIGMLSSPDPDMRRRALYGLARAPRPGGEAVATMKSILEKDPYNTTALFALGSYSRRFRDDGKADEARELGAYLVQRLAATSDSMRRTIVLRAIQNSGYAGGLVDITKCLDDRNEDVRRAAILALGPIRDSAVDDILAAHLRAGVSTGILMSLIEAARARPESDKLVSAIMGVYRSAAVPVRYRALDLLVRWLPRHPALHAFLEDVGQSDPEERIRRIAKAAL
jgi:hypothetical protein